MCLCPHSAEEQQCPRVILVCILSMNFKDSLYRIPALQQYQQSVTPYSPLCIAIDLSFLTPQSSYTIPNPSSPPLPCIARRGSLPPPSPATACYAFRTPAIATNNVIVHTQRKFPLKARGKRWPQGNAIRLWPYHMPIMQIPYYPSKLIWVYFFFLVTTLQRWAPAARSHLLCRERGAQRGRGIAARAV